MSFQTGLSGLNASSRNLDVIGNNIANANTVGMKSSRAEFADIVASSLGTGGSGSAPGIGVSVATVAQQFTQGNINITGNSLDVAINGGGFFMVKKLDGRDAVTRDGQFKLDQKGFLRTNAGSYILSYDTDADGNKIGANQPIKRELPTGDINANPTTKISAELNLDARANLAVGAPAKVGPPAIAAVPITPISRYGTSVTVYDSQGVSVTKDLYFFKVGPDLSAAPPVLVDQWHVIDGDSLTEATSILNSNAAVYSDPANAATIDTNNANSLRHLDNSAINKARDDENTLNTALRTANDALDVKNTALNAAALAAGTPGWVMLPTYALGTLEKIPTKADSGWSKFTPPALGSVIDKLTSARLATFENDAIDVNGAPVPGTKLPPNDAMAGMVDWKANLPLVATMEFDTTGKLKPSATTPTLTIKSKNPAIPPSSAELDISNVTLFGSNFNVTKLSQDGYTSGSFVSLNIDGKGVISTSYSNGQTLKTGGMIALGNVRNLQGLSPIGSGEYMVTPESGALLNGQPSAGVFGELRAGAVEESNVDLTSELVNMMTAQRNYQANAQTIKTQDQIMSTLVNMR
jgi:flagellar hook protein FlgE